MFIAPALLPEATSQANHLQPGGSESALEKPTADSTPVFGNPDGTLSALKTSALGLCCGHLIQMLWKCLLNGKLRDTELHKHMKEPSGARSPWGVFDSF